MHTFVCLIARPCDDIWKTSNTASPDIHVPKNQLIIINFVESSLRNNLILSTQFLIFHSARHHTIKKVAVYCYNSNIATQASNHHVTKSTHVTRRPFADHQTDPFADQQTDPNADHQTDHQTDPYADHQTDHQTDQKFRPSNRSSHCVDILGNQLVEQTVFQRQPSTTDDII